jgi:hypothetical protein
MPQSPSSEANTCSPTQENSRIWYVNVPYHGHKNRQLNGSYLGLWFFIQIALIYVSIQSWWQDYWFTDSQCNWFIDWLWPYSPDAPRPLLTGLLCPITIPVTLPKFQMAHRLTFLIFSGSRKKQPRYACLSEAKASHQQRIGAEVSSCAPHFLHNELSAPLSGDVFSEYYVQ